MPGRCALQRIFSAFPGGPPGIGLLILRTVAGVILMAQGMVCLLWRPHVAATLLVAAVLLLLTGMSLLVGFLTPILSPLAGLEYLSMALSWFPVPASSLIDSKLAATEMIAMSAAIALLGPGAFSLDARIFGWREIIIPPMPPKSED
jgi:uncharacterized membrane protein YphA (DoxX/SURF4 family)